MIRPGRVRRALLVFVALLALLAIWLSGIGVAGAVVAGVAAGAMLCRQWPVRARRLRLGPGRTVQLELDARTVVSGTVGRPAFVSPWFVGLSVVPRCGRRYHLGLFRDQTEPDAFRRLAARLRGA